MVRSLGSKYDQPLPKRINDPGFRQARADAQDVWISAAKLNTNALHQARIIPFNPSEILFEIRNNRGVFMAKYHGWALLLDNHTDITELDDDGYTRYRANCQPFRHEMTMPNGQCPLGIAPPDVGPADSDVALLHNIQPPNLTQGGMTVYSNEELVNLINLIRALFPYNILSGRPNADPHICLDGRISPDHSASTLYDLLPDRPMSARFFGARTAQCVCDATRSVAAFIQCLRYAESDDRGPHFDRKFTPKRLANHVDQFLQVDRWSFDRCWRFLCSRSSMELMFQARDNMGKIVMNQIKEGGWGYCYDLPNFNLPVVQPLAPEHRFARVPFRYQYDWMGGNNNGGGFGGDDGDDDDDDDNDDDDDDRRRYESTPPTSSSGFSSSSSRSHSKRKPSTKRGSSSSGKRCSSSSLPPNAPRSPQRRRSASGSSSSSSVIYTGDTWRRAKRYLSQDIKPDISHTAVGGNKSRSDIVRSPSPSPLADAFGTFSAAPTPASSRTRTVPTPALARPGQSNYQDIEDQGSRNGRGARLSDHLFMLTDEERLYFFGEGEDS